MKLRANRPQPQHPRPALGRRRFVALGLGVVGLLVATAGRLGAQSPGAYQVVVNVKNPAKALKRELLADMFLKRLTRWEHGEAVSPADQDAGTAVRQAFSRGVLRRSASAVRHYWTQRIFSGRDLPPPELADDQAVLRYVASHPGAVGYVAPGTSVGTGTKAVAVSD